MNRELTKEQRQHIFFKIVEQQDAGTAIEQSRQRVSEEFQITIKQVVTIEQQGRLDQWPPLS